MEDALALYFFWRSRSADKVLILVLMEDALAPISRSQKWKEYYVLILVLMEDALARIRQSRAGDVRNSLNPCFNGRCTRTGSQSSNILVTDVLILVLMEDALAHFPCRC